MELGQIYIYRMTHLENIPHILLNGITHKSSSNTNPKYISIGDVSLIDTGNFGELKKIHTFSEKKMIHEYLHSLLSYFGDSRVKKTSRI